MADRHIKTEVLVDAVAWETRKPWVFGQVF
jgi:hypothetical protein